MIFETERLIVRLLKLGDKTAFFELMGNPKVMNPIPLDAMSEIESDAHLIALINLQETKSDKLIWAIDLPEGDKFIGLCALLVNDEGNPEIAYRLREGFWGLGYGTEITKGLINYSFNKMGNSLITADVNVENTRSVKILNKFFKPVREFYNEKDKCYDRRYHLDKKDWNI